ncbi:MAG: ATP synthase F1 subunit gamma [Proteobacteria bacterium]|nr:ATP synthase F1 subunit gamma [Pseudomonadota bacterium]
MPQSTREILRRIKGIKSTQQITRAMEMVAAVKLNRVRTLAENSRPYVNRLGTLMRIIRSSEMAVDHPVFSTKEGSRLLLIVITSDRGLCGTFNINMINAVLQFLEEQKGKQVSIIAVGKKGYDTLVRRGYAIEQFFPVPWGLTLASELRTINTLLTEGFNAQKIDGVHLYYTQFVNVLHHVPTHVKLLPLSPLSEEEKKHLIKGEIDFIMEPSFQELALALIPQYIETQIYHCLIESVTSEQAARMVSMRNATDNADEMIKNLTLTFNKVRQASITRELIDIIGGVEAMKG